MRQNIIATLEDTDRTLQLAQVQFFKTCVRTPLQTS